MRVDKARHTVFWNVMEVISSDDDCAGHFGRNNLAGQYATTDRDISSERALLVNVCAIDSLGRNFESKTNILIPSLLLGRYFLSAFIVQLANSFDTDTVGNSPPRAFAFWKRCCF